MSSSDSSDCDEPDFKRPKLAGPTSIVTWNANGLVSRCLYNADQLSRLLRETDEPDIFCLQEVRLKAINSDDRGTPQPNDYKSVKDALESTIFHKYRKHWSLADTKYAGTLTLVHKRLASNYETAFCTQSALSLLLEKYKLKREDIGLSVSSDKEKKKAKKQTSMKNFFAPKAKSSSSSSPKGKLLSKTSVEHHPEGRFQFFMFESCDLIQTYVPNNGTKEESFQRRRAWDQTMKEFLKHRQAILQKAASTSNNNGDNNNDSSQERPLLWCGDMNVAADYRDGTHWEQRAPGKGNDNDSGGKGIYEWWRDEKQCFAGGQAKSLDPDRHSDDKGIPSFTTGERRRFNNLLEEAGLADVWRTLHPNGVEEDQSSNRNYRTQWDRPNWSWRGHLSKGNSYMSKYQGKAQRLDYFLLSPSSLASKDIVDKCEMLGYGENREGLFCGSDHCATVFKLKKPF